MTLSSVALCICTRRHQRKRQGKQTGNRTGTHRFGSVGHRHYGRQTQDHVFQVLRIRHVTAQEIAQSLEGQAHKRLWQFSI